MKVRGELELVHRVAFLIIVLAIQRNAFGDGSDLQIVAFQCYSLAEHSWNLAKYPARQLESGYR